MIDYESQIVTIIKEIRKLANQAYSQGCNDGKTVESEFHIKNEYQRGYDEAKVEFYNNRYQEGLDDAWIIARKIICGGIGDYTKEQLREIFGNGNQYAILKHFTIFDVIKKIKEYENKCENECENTSDNPMGCGECYECQIEKPIKCEILQNECIYTKDKKVLCTKCPVFNAFWKGRGE